MDAAADLAASGELKAGLFLYLSDGGVGGGLPVKLWELSVTEQRYRAVLEVRMLCTSVPLDAWRSAASALTCPPCSARRKRRLST
jgi:hypothetical protein